MRIPALARWAALGVVAAAAAAVSLPLVSSASGPTTFAVQLPAGKENTSIIVQNVGASNATIALDLYTPGGVVIPAASKVEANVPPGGTRTFAQALNAGLLPGFRGVGVVSSDQKIDALTVRDILDVSGMKSYSIAGMGATGASKLAIPIAFNELVTAQWNSRISVANTSGTAVACIRVTYFLVPNVGGAATTGTPPVIDSPGGQTGCPGGGYAIAGGGQIVFGRSGAGVTQFHAGTINNQMAVLIEVLNGGAVVANVDIYRSDGNRLLGSYEASAVGDAGSATDDVGTSSVIPLAIKSPSGYYTVIGVQNITATPANVSINYIGVDGNGSPVNVSVSLGSVSNVAFHSVYSSNDVPVGFVGYATVTADQPVATVLIRGKQTVAFSGVNEGIYTAARGIPTDQAATSFNVPLIFRRFAGGDGFFGYNSWIQVQVANGGTAQVTLRFVGDPASGCPVGPYQATFTVTGSRVFYMNLDSDNGFPAGNSPSCFWGGAQVTANTSIIVVSNVTADKFPADSDPDGLYSGFK